MENNTRTLYGLGLQTALFTGLATPMMTYTTLNELLDINPGIVPTLDNQPKMRYFALDRGGVSVVPGSDGTPLPYGAQHQSTDAAGFSMFPFVLRLPANDLAAADRAKYGLRRLEVHNGTTYVAYYLKRIDFTGAAVLYKYTTVNSDGSTTVTNYVPTQANLNPVPQALSSTGVNKPTGDSVTASTTLDLSLSADDCTEILNAATIIYNDERYAILTNIALVSGVDATLASPSGVGADQIQMLEVTAAQVTHFYNTFQAITYDKSGVTISLNVGSTEPLMKLAS